MAANWASSLFNQFKNVTDVLNVGRVIFYPAAGILPTVPALMIPQVMANPLEPSFAEQFLCDFNFVLIETESPLILFFTALIVGFLIATAAFCLVIHKLGAEARKEAEEGAINNKSHAYQYPFLKDDETTDYQQWLISEYYRYVELATFIPVGFLLSLPLVSLYNLIYLIRLLGEGKYTPFAWGTPLCILFFIATWFCWIVLWRKFWVVKVVKRTLAVYHNAKVHLIDGVRKFKEEQNELRKQNSS